MKTINNLPDQCLERIFSHLPVRDLLKIEQVSPTWKSIQSTVCCKQHNLVILIGKKSNDLTKNSPFRTHFYYDYALSNNNQELIYPNDQLEFDWLDERSANLLTRLLPNIASISISIGRLVPFIYLGERSCNVKSILMNQVIMLLKSWSNKLKTLKLYIHFDASNERSQVQIEVDMRSLLSAIANLHELNHLTFEYSDYFIFSNRKAQVAFPVLPKLKVLNLCIDDQLSVIRDSLLEYSTSQSLVSLSIGRLLWFEIEAHLLQPYDDALYRKVTRIPHLQFFGPNSETLKRVCSRFVNLEMFQIRITSSAQMCAYAQLLKPLTKLVFLDVYFCFEDEDDDNDDDYCENETETNSIPQIRSVKIIRINGSQLSHTDFCLIKWERLFPNLEVVHFRDDFNECSICRPENDNETEQDESARQDACFKLAIQSWKQCSKLHSIYTGDKVPKRWLSLSDDDSLYL